MSESCIKSFLNLATNNGAVIQLNTPVVSITPTENKVVVQTKDKRYEAGKVILTAGAYINEFLPEFSRQLELWRLVAGWFKPDKLTSYKPDKFPSFVLIEKDHYSYGFPSIKIPGVKIGFSISKGKKIDSTKEMARDIKDEDIEDYYKTKIANFKVKKMYKAAHILFRIEPKGDSSEESIEKAAAEAEQEANDILRRIRGGAEFGELAKKYSDDPTSGENGGSLGEFPMGIMVPEFEKALEKLKPGEISEPTRTSFGFHIIRLEEVKAKRIKPFGSTFR